MVLVIGTKESYAGIKLGLKVQDDAKLRSETRSQLIHLTNPYWSGYRVQTFKYSEVNPHPRGAAIQVRVEKSLNKLIYTQQ